MKFILKMLLMAISCMNFFLEAKVIHVTSLSQLMSIINNNKNVLIKFYSDTCPPCRIFAPIYKQISEESAYNSITFVEVNTQQSRDITSHYSVQSIPKIIVIKNQQVIGTTGGKNFEQFKSLLKNYFSL